MAKSKKHAEFDDSAHDEAAASAEVAALADASPAAWTNLWRVELNCPTPLAHKVAEVEGENAEQAKEAYCRLNGICDSKHEWRVERVKG